MATKKYMTFLYMSILILFFFSLWVTFYVVSCLSFNLEITMSFVTCIWMMVSSLVISRNGLSSCHLQMVRFHCFEKKKKISCLIWILAKISVINVMLLHYLGMEKSPTCLAFLIWVEWLCSSNLMIYLCENLLLRWQR